MAALEVGMAGLMRFLFVAERGEVGYYYIDLRMGHGGCSVTTPLLIGV